MKSVVESFWRNHRVLLVGFAAALCLTMFFFARTVMYTLHWSDPAHREQAVDGWMPMGYVARSWDVPPEVLREALGPAADTGNRVTVAEIAHERGMRIDEVAELLHGAILARRAETDE